MPQIAVDEGAQPASSQSSAPVSVLASQSNESIGLKTSTTTSSAHSSKGEDGIAVSQQSHRFASAESGSSLLSESLEDEPIVRQLGGRRKKPSSRNGKAVPLARIDDARPSSVDRKGDSHGLAASKDSHEAVNSASLERTAEDGKVDGDDDEGGVEAMIDADALDGQGDADDDAAAAEEEEDDDDA